MKAIYQGIIVGVLGTTITAIVLVLFAFSNPLTNIINPESISETKCKTLGDQIENLYKQNVNLEADIPVGTAGMSEKEAQELMKKEREYAIKISPIRTEFAKKLSEYKDLGCDFRRFVDSMTNSHGNPLDEKTKNRLKFGSP